MPLGQQATHRAVCQQRSSCSVQLHMQPGKLGAYDERELIYPEAPLFSKGGRMFLKALSYATKKRLELTLRLIPISSEGYWENCR